TYIPNTTGSCPARWTTQSSTERCTELKPPSPRCVSASDQTPRHQPDPRSRRDRRTTSTHLRDGAGRRGEPARREGPRLRIHPGTQEDPTVLLTVRHRVLNRLDLDRDFPELRLRPEPVWRSVDLDLADRRRRPDHRGTFDRGAQHQDPTGRLRLPVGG